MNIYFSGYIISLELVLIIILLFKIIRIHKVVLGIQETSLLGLRESEETFSQIQSFWALEKKLGLTETLPKMRKWAGSPDFLLFVADEVLARKPSVVMECSSGVSTVVVARCLQLTGFGHVYSLEHDPIFAEKTRQMLKKYNVLEWATVIDAPLTSEHTATPWYSEAAIPSNLPLVDMLIVDGPPTATAPLARYPALPRLISRMTDRFIIFVDDANRADEIEMVRLWRELYPSLHCTQIDCEKGLVMLEANPENY